MKKKPMKKKPMKKKTKKETHAVSSLASEAVVRSPVRWRYVRGSSLNPDQLLYLAKRLDGRNVGVMQENLLTYRIGLSDRTVTAAELQLFYGIGVETSLEALPEGAMSIGDMEKSVLLVGDVETATPHTYNDIAKRSFSDLRQHGLGITLFYIPSFDPEWPDVGDAVVGFVRGVDWDVFNADTAEPTVQAVDEKNSLEDHEAILLARHGGLTVKDDGVVTYDPVKPSKDDSAAEEELAAECEKLQIEDVELGVRKLKLLRRAGWTEKSTHTYAGRTFWVAPGPDVWTYSTIDEAFAHEVRTRQAREEEEDGD